MISGQMRRGRNRLASSDHHRSPQQTHRSDGWMDKFQGVFFVGLVSVRPMCLAFACFVGDAQCRVVVVVWLFVAGFPFFLCPSCFLFLLLLLLLLFIPINSSSTHTTNSFIHSCISIQLIQIQRWPNGSSGEESWRVEINGLQQQQQQHIHSQISQRPAAIVAFHSTPFHALNQSKNALTSLAPSIAFFSHGDWLNPFHSMRQTAVFSHSPRYAFFHIQCNVWWQWRRWINRVNESRLSKKKWIG